MISPSGACFSKRGVIRQAPARVNASWSAYFALSRKMRSLGPARSSAATLEMRRSSEAPAAGSAPVRVAISPMVRSLTGSKNWGPAIPPIPVFTPGARSEFRPAPEGELLGYVVAGLPQSARVIEPQGPERGLPDQASPDRCANGLVVLDVVEGFSSRRRGRRTLIAPERSSVCIERCFDTHFFGHEEYRGLELKASAPIIRAAKRII